MLIRRASEAPTASARHVRPRVLMDAGELGSRNLSITWLEVPPGAAEELRTDDQSEQAYVVVRGEATLSVAGDVQTLAPGDMALVSPATEHEVANRAGEELALVSVQSPGVSADELYGGEVAAALAEQYEEE